MSRINRSQMCPICSSKKYRDIIYTEEYGTVEEHAYCQSCGYTIEMAYSDPIVGFTPDITRGYKALDGYRQKNTRIRKRMRRKFNIKRSNEDRFLMYI